MCAYHPVAIVGHVEPSVLIILLIPTVHQTAIRIGISMVVDSHREPSCGTSDGISHDVCFRWIDLDRVLQLQTVPLAHFVFGDSVILAEHLYRLIGIGSFPDER